LLHVPSFLELYSSGYHFCVLNNFGMFFDYAILLNDKSLEWLNVWLCFLEEIYVIVSTFLLFLRFSVLCFFLQLIYLDLFSAPFFFHSHTEVLFFYSYFFLFFLIVDAMVAVVTRVGVQGEDLYPEHV
jgi:hypothetical protein